MRLLAFALLLVASQAWGAQYYVRPGNSNYGTGDGLSYANAFGSATSFFTTPVAGDDLYFCGTMTAGVTLGDNGVNAGNYQIIDGSCPVGDGTFDPLICTNTTGYCITASGKKYTRVQNITTRGAAGVRLQSTSGAPCHGCQIVNVTCASGTASGLSCARIEGPVATGNMTTPATEVLMENITCTEPSAHCAAIMEYAVNPVMRRCNSTGGGDGANVWMCYIKPPSESITSWTLVSGDVYSATVSNSDDIEEVVSSAVFSTNRYYMTENDGATTTVGAGEWDQSGTTLYVNKGAAGNPGTILIVYAQTTGAVIEDSVATDASASYDGVGIGIDFGAINGTLRHNLSYGNPGSGYELGLGDGHKAYGNIAFGNGKYGLRASWTKSSALVYNNSFSGNTLGGVDVYRAQSGVTIIFQNNAMLGVGSGDVGVGFTETLYAVVDEDFNDIYGFETARESGISTGLSSIASLPDWIGGTSPTTAEGFKLKSTSPLRRAGKDLNIGNVQDYNNRAFLHPPSSGAWESASGDEILNRTIRD